MPDTPSPAPRPDVEAIRIRAYSEIDPEITVGLLRTDINALIAHIKALEERQVKLRELLENLAEYFDDYAIAEYLPCEAAPVGNKEMRLMGEIREALAALGDSDG